jgi:hypothetical protein
MPWRIISILYQDRPSSKIARPGYALNRPVNKSGPVNGENGELEGLREANEPNHGG